MNGFEIGAGPAGLMFLPYATYGALYQSGLVERVVNLASADDLESAWAVVADATKLAASMECSWCDSPGLHGDCWTPRSARG